MPIDLTLPTDGQSDWDVPLNAALTTLETAVNDQETAIAGKADSGHTHPSTEVSDFTEAVQDAVAALLAAGTNVSLSYDDAGNLLTITATSGGGSTDPEVVRDTIGVALAGIGNITVTVDDAGDTITISTTATANSTDAALRDRSTHTGTQPLSSVAITGTPDGGKFLRDDGSWAAVPTAALAVVDAGTDLSAARPGGATVVYWMFDAGVDPGTDGANVVNGVDGDLYYVAGA